MVQSVLKFLRKLLRSTGLDIVKYNPLSFAQRYPDFDPDISETIHQVQDFTMTSPERLFSLCEAVKYVINNDIPGDMVECGVWKGGSMMAVARTLLQLNNNSRHLYLFDTFEGMTAPTAADVDFLGRPAAECRWEQVKDDDLWCYAPLVSVMQAMQGVGYDPQKIHLIKGRVEETIPEQAPDAISLLRLDTDWYESTRHELLHLFPRLAVGGVIIIDDYGYWEGARRAVDEYLKENKIKLLLNRVDFTGRIGVRLA